MKNIFFLYLIVLLSLISAGCLENNSGKTTKYQVPSMDHDLSYIPYDAKFDNPNFTICDSTKIKSGRNKIQYIGGRRKLKKDIISKYLNKKKHETFNGYIVIRFLVNCEGKSGRYRAQSLNFDFSPLNPPLDLLESSIDIIKNLDNWKRSVKDSQIEYSKYINLKIKDGNVQHILL